MQPPQAFSIPASFWIKSNAEYIKVLYRTFLGREYDIQGFYDWLGKLDSNKMTRDQVLQGFSNSPEFRKIMKEYGL